MSTRVSRHGVGAAAYLEKMLGPLTLATLLRATREGEAMSQQDFARKLGLSKSHLCDIEAGRKAVSPERAASFARTLGYPVIQYVQLALQDLLNRGRLAFDVELRPHKPTRGRAA